MSDYVVRIDYHDQTAIVRSMEGEGSSLPTTLIEALEMLTRSLDTKKVASDLVIGFLEYAEDSRYRSEDLRKAEESLYLAAEAFNKAYGKGGPAA